MMVGGDFSFETIKVMRQNSTVRLIFRALPLGLYLAYYLAMKTSYRMHELTVGETKPLLKDAVIWSFIGGFIELAVLLAGGYLYSYVIG
jgi:hypothetical protein